MEWSSTLIILSTPSFPFSLLFRAVTASLGGVVPDLRRPLERRTDPAPSTFESGAGLESHLKSRSTEPRVTKASAVAHNWVWHLLGPHPPPDHPFRHPGALGQDLREQQVSFKNYDFTWEYYYNESVRVDQWIVWTSKNGNGVINSWNFNLFLLFFRQSSICLFSNQSAQSSISSWQSCKSE